MITLEHTALDDAILLQRISDDGVVLCREGRGDSRSNARTIPSIEPSKSRNSTAFFFVCIRSPRINNLCASAPRNPPARRHRSRNLLDRAVLSCGFLQNIYVYGAVHIHAHHLRSNDLPIFYRAFLFLARLSFLLRAKSIHRSKCH